MAGNIIVGFAPAAAAGKAATGLAPAADAAADPLGVFGALLDRMTAGGDDAIDFLPMSLQELQALTGGGAQPATLPGVEYRLAVPVEPEVDAEEVLAGLVDALAQLDQALADGAPVAPALGKKISDALDALAGLLGLALPTDPALPVPPPAIDAAAIAPAAATADGATPLPPADGLDVLLALAAAAAPLPRSDSGLAPAPAGGDAEPGVVFTAPTVAAAPAGPAPAAAAIAAPVPEAAPATAAPPTAPVEAGQPPSPPASSVAATPQPAVDPASGLGQLVGKIAELARALEPQSPGLARRLEALVQKLGSGEISAATLAELGLDDAPALSESDLDRALTRLLTASSEAKGTPAPQAFAAAQLKLPQAMALPPAAPEPAPAGAPAGPGTEAPAEPEPRMALEPKVAEPQDSGEPQPANRGSAADARAVAAARPEAAAEPTSTSQPAVQVATTTAVIAGTKAVHAAYQAPVHQINIPQVAFEMVRQIQAGNSRFQIRLDPPELGRIDVRLDVDHSGNVNARMTVERSETLDLMQRDQRSLERALAQAGLDSSKTSLEFSLRQNPSGRDDGGDGRPKGSPFGGAGGETAGPGDDVPEQIQTLYRGSASASGVNLFV